MCTLHVYEARAPSTLAQRLLHPGLQHAAICTASQTLSAALHSQRRSLAWSGENAHLGIAEVVNADPAAHLMKLRSSGSSASAARWNRSSKSSTTFWKESLKMPLMLHSTSTRGLPSISSKGISSNLQRFPEGWICL